MNGQHACCVLELCCRKREDAVKALAEMLRHPGVESPPMPEGADEMDFAAAKVFQNFDLVPKGLAKAIIDAYEPHFAEFAKRGTTNE